MRARNGLMALATAVLLAATGPAMAEGCHQGAFSGLYIGATVGAASLEAKHYPRDEPTLSDSDTSAAGGVHAGYNLQCGQFVIGAEAGFNLTDLSVSNTQTGVAFPATFTTSLDWFGTIRGRVGFLIREDMMIYATGGYAFADRTHHISGTSPGGAFAFSNDDSADGWTFGGGIEFLRGDRWLLRAEALYVDLGREDRVYTVPGACGGPCRAFVGWDDSFWTARLGLSIKLGREERHYEPLK